MNEYDINVKQGATFKLILTLKDPNGDAIDLSGYSFRGKIRKTPTDPKVQANFTFNILPQADDTLGQVEAILTPEATAGIEVPEIDKPHRKIVTMLYDIESEQNGEVVRWLEGKAYISPEVTW